jgi:hypothetical protein
MMALTITMGLHLQADDTAPKGAGGAATGKEKNAATGKKEEAKDSDPSLLQKLTKELFKEIDEDPPEGAEKEKENKLDRAAKGMRTAGEKLDDKRTGDDTRKIQEQVIRDLEDLIKQLQNPPPSQGGGGGAMSKAQVQKMQGQRGQQGQSSRSQQANAQGAEGAAAKKSGGREKETPGGSEERSESDKKAAEEAARKKKLEMDVWGHLPPHLREQLLNTYGERMLPKYQQLVKQFYEALSEQGDSRR